MDTEEQKDPTTELKDLEEAFQSEAGTPPSFETPSTQPAVTQDGFSSTKNSLISTDERIAKKIETLKSEAKKELETLKSLKEGIAKKIADIKELEETREKIKKELDKLSGLESEVESIKKEAENELEDN